jgi:hypothetical protein
MSKKVKLVEQTDEKNNRLFQKIKAEIINQLTHCDYNGHIDDIGNLVGIAVGRHIGNKNIWAFEKDDFLSGFDHGYSLEDGTHG